MKKETIKAVTSLNPFNIQNYFDASDPITPTSLGENSYGLHIMESFSRYYELFTISSKALIAGFVHHFVSTVNNNYANRGLKVQTIRADCSTQR